MGEPQTRATCSIRCRQCFPLEQTTNEPADSPSSGLGLAQITIWVFAESLTVCHQVWKTEDWSANGARSSKRWEAKPRHGSDHESSIAMGAAGSMWVATPDNVEETRQAL